jgi:hypothetical protein
MILQYGNYSHDDNEIWLVLDSAVVWSPVGRRMKSRVRWTVTGVKKAATQAALTTALAVLEDAYAADNLDITLWTDTAKTIKSQHFQASGDTLDGIRVTNFGYLKGNPGIWGSGSEYVLRRTFRFTLEYELLTTEINVLFYHERITQIGDGGPRFKMMGALQGPVQKQQLQQFTPYVAIQQGNAIGMLDHPNFPASLWPGALHRDKSVISEDTPKEIKRFRNTVFPISWKYVHESATALVGGPQIVL